MVYLTFSSDVIGLSFQNKSCFAKKLMEVDELISESTISSVLWVAVVSIYYHIVCKIKQSEHVAIPPPKSKYQGTSNTTLKFMNQYLLRIRKMFLAPVFAHHTNFTHTNLNNQNLICIIFHLIQ